MYKEIIITAISVAPPQYVMPLRELTINTYYINYIDRLQRSPFLELNMNIQNKENKAVRIETLVMATNCRPMLTQNMVNQTQRTYL